MKISVCLASYNGEKYIQQQIESILSCLNENDELLISDDGSTDNTVEIVNAYENQKITLHHNSAPHGVVANFKNAVSKAKGEIIVLSDQDDVWLQNRLEKTRELHEKYSVVTSNGSFCDESLNTSTKTLFNAYPQTTSSIKVVLRNCFVGCSMSFTQNYKEIFLNIPSNAPMHDWVIGLYASIKKDIYFDDEVRFLFRRHSANASSTGLDSKQRLMQKFKDRYLLLKSIVKLSKRRY